MEASKSAREDLKAIMDGVKQINDAKASLRRNAQPAGRMAQKQNPSNATAVTANRTPVEPRPIPKAPFDIQVQAAKNDPDSFSEMGERESLRLQLITDKLSKADAATSSAMRKFADTAQSMTQNLK